jgi:large subunit ribosomal protein L4
VVVVDRFGWTAPSTKSAKAALDALGTSGKTLVVLRRSDEVAARSFNNLTDVQVIDVGELNAYDVLCNTWIVFTNDTLPSSAPGSSASEPDDGDDTADTADATEEVEA